jgi:hypothetical protein
VLGDPVSRRGEGSWGFWDFRVLLSIKRGIGSDQVVHEMNSRDLRIFYLNVKVRILQS